MENLIGFSIINYYTGGRGRTGTSLRTLDFESSASANSATPASITGVAGFEPTHEGVKVPCLTAWLYPNNNKANDGNRTHACQSHNLVC